MRGIPEKRHPESHGHTHPDTHTIVKGQNQGCRAQHTGRRYDHWKTAAPSLKALSF